MANPGSNDAEPPRRPRRGPPPRLYVIARKSPLPWLRVRRLVEADRAALVAHLGRQATALRQIGQATPDQAGIAALCAGLDFARTIAFGAIAGNTIVAAACGMPGLEVAATEEADYRDHDLGRMLVSQVLGAGFDRMPPASPPGAAERALLRLLRSCGSAAEDPVEPHPDLAQSA